MSKRLKIQKILLYLKNLAKFRKMDNLNSILLNSKIVILNVVLVMNGIYKQFINSNKTQIQTNVWQ